MGSEMCIRDRDAACLLIHNSSYGFSSAVRSQFAGYLGHDLALEEALNWSPSPTPLEMGLYALHLRRWTGMGWNRSQILVTSFSELVNPTSDALARVRSFAGVGPFAYTKLPHINSADGKEGVQTQIRCYILARLQNYFAGPNRVLYAQLDEDRRSGKAPPEERPFEEFAHTNLLEGCY